MPENKEILKKKKNDGDMSKDHRSQSEDVSKDQLWTIWAPIWIITTYIPHIQIRHIYKPCILSFTQKIKINESNKK